MGRRNKGQERETETSGEINGGQEGVVGAFLCASVSGAGKSPKELKPRPRDVAAQINPTWSCAAGSL